MPLRAAPSLTGFSKLYPLAWGLVVFSVVNAAYTVSRTRKYRMFEADIDAQPSTPSARRVRVQSSPVSSSPLRLIADLMTPEPAEPRAHPDKNKDVWELSVWDPLPICLRLACFFSPGHVLVYLVFLPLAPLDPRPSMTIFNTLVMQLVLSTQLLLLCARFSQQSRDTTIIKREVMHEYDAKYVHPRLYPVVRDVGIQVSEEQSTAKTQDSVQYGTPTTLLRRNFKPHPNPHIDSTDATPFKSHSNFIKPNMFTPPIRRGDSLAPATDQRGSAPRRSLPASYTAQTEAQVAPSAGSRNYAGNMGIYTHNRSPLKKAISMGEINKSGQPSPRNSREMAAYEQRGWEPPSSPTKKLEHRKALGSSAQTSPHPLANVARHRPQYERYPSRW